MLKRGDYQTRGGLVARLPRNIESKRGLGIILGVGFATYNQDGTLTYKESHRVGDKFDLLPDTWQPLKGEEVRS